MVDDGDGKGRGRGPHDAFAATLATPPPVADTIVATGTPTSLAAVAPLASLRQLDTSRYRLTDRIGLGGMGEVILAHDDQIGREVVVKRIRTEQSSDESIARFVREARVQGRLEHPAIVPVHDLAVDAARRPLFVMKKLIGVELREVLATLGAGTAEDAFANRGRLLRAFVDVCLAVEFAHSRGIVHRDLKPSNIMLGDYGEVYVLDWGIARAMAAPEDSSTEAPPSNLALASGDTNAGTVLGTPAYMAPEQLLGIPADASADIYALGCILFEIVAGRPLHDSPRTLASALRPPDATPSRHRSDCPPELDDICRRATAGEPAARFESARSLATAVQAFLDGDRDVEARKKLARHHLAEARAALARGDDDEDVRRTAMRAAGRALALDPTTTDAAELISRLVLAPPVQVPVEVVSHIDALEIETARRQGRLGAVAMTGYLWFLPLLFWTGVRSAAVVAAFTGCALLNAGVVWAMTRRERLSRPGIYLSAVVHATLIAVVCRLVGPFLIAPTLVLTTLMAYAVHPQFGSMKVVTPILVAGVAVPWALEAAGVVPATYHFIDGHLVIGSHAITFAAAPVQVAFAVSLVLLAAIVAVLLRTLALRQRAATTQIEVQAWHLRQVVAK